MELVRLGDVSFSKVLRFVVVMYFVDIFYSTSGQRLTVGLAMILTLTKVDGIAI